MQQEIFDIVVLHLYRQGHPAYDQKEGCLYRAPNGDKCAVGVLIPDQVYDPGMEGKSVDNQNFSFSKVLPKYIHQNIDLLLALQGVHDEWDDWKFSDIQPQLETIADEYNLTFPDLTQPFPTIRLMNLHVTP